MHDLMQWPAVRFRATLLLVASRTAPANLLDVSMIPRRRPPALVRANDGCWRGPGISALPASGRIVMARKSRCGRIVKPKRGSARAGVRGREGQGYALKPVD